MTRVSPAGRAESASVERLRLGAERQMNMLYGVNQADQCWDFALGPGRERIWELLRQIDTRLVRLFLFDKGAPDPVKEWPVFASYVQAVLNVGAVPMITFAKLHRPLDDPRAIRWFANQCSDVVWNCIEQWGGDVVRKWYWCLWNEPNNAWISGDVSFEQYRRIYLEVADGVSRWLGPYLGERKLPLGGPGVEGFQPFWFDWVWRFLHEVDDALIGFLDWHCYGDWREHGENGAPLHPPTHQALMLSQAYEYEQRANAIARLLHGRGIHNICGELNAHSHYTEAVRARFNYSIFGATFYALSLLHLLRAGVFAEMYWTGTEDRGGYGMMDKDGRPRPSFHVKRLFAQHVSRGDWISFWDSDNAEHPLRAVSSRSRTERRSVLVAHMLPSARTYPLADLLPVPGDCTRLLKIDGSTNEVILEESFSGAVSFDGYGVGVVTNAENDTPA